METNTMLSFADTIYCDIRKIIDATFSGCTQKDLDRRKSKSFMRLFFLMVLKLKKMFFVDLHSALTYCVSIENEIQSGINIDDYDLEIE